VPCRKHPLLLLIQGVVAYTATSLLRGPPLLTKIGKTVDTGHVGQSTLSGPPPSGPPLMGANYSIKYKFPVHADRNEVSKETTEELGVSSS
jgi:hypothetical protein